MSDDRLVHMLRSDHPDFLTAAAADRIEILEDALGVALSALVKFEPGDSRAVSDEFVALAAVQCGLENDEARAIIAAAKAREQAANK